MRILHLIATLGGGGAERQLAYLSRGLQSEGWDVHIGLVREGVNFAAVREGGVTAHFLKARGNYDPILLFRLVRLIRTVKPDVVQTWLPQMDVLGGLAATVTRTPWIVSERSSGEHYPRDWREALRRWTAKLASVIVANSPGGLDFWKRSPVPSEVIANAVPLADIDVTEPESSLLDGGYVLLFVGRLDEVKNLSNLLQAFELLFRDVDGVALLCGDGPLRGEVRNWVEARGLARRIQLLGFTDRVWNLMKLADALVAVSWFEGHPNAVLEAAACRCPLILSDIPAHRAIFDTRSAEFVSPHDPHDIARGIKAVLAERSEARQRAERARQAVEGLSIEAATTAYARIYRRLAGES